MNTQALCTIDLSENPYSLPWKLFKEVKDKRQRDMKGLKIFGSMEKMWCAYREKIHVTRKKLGRPIDLRLSPLKQKTSQHRLSDCIVCILCWLCGLHWRFLKDRVFNLGKEIRRRTLMLRRNLRVETKLFSRYKHWSLLGESYDNLVIYQAWLVLTHHLVLHEVKLGEGWIINT